MGRNLKELSQECKNAYLIQIDRYNVCLFCLNLVKYELLLNTTEYNGKFVYVDKIVS